MTLVLIGKDLVLEASTTKIEDKQVPGIYIYTVQTSMTLDSKGSFSFIFRVSNIKKNQRLLNFSKFFAQKTQVMQLHG